jgi:hypothetical protein
MSEDLEISTYWQEAPIPKETVQELTGTRMDSNYYYLNEAGNMPKAVVKLNQFEGLYYIDYYDKMGNVFYTESFHGKSVHYVEDAAENWALGHKILPTGNTQRSLL